MTKNTTPFCPLRNNEICMGRACGVAVRVNGGWVCGFASPEGKRRIVHAEPTEHDMFQAELADTGFTVPQPLEPVPFYKPSDYDLCER